MASYSDNRRVRVVVDSMTSLLKHPSAWIPIALSFAVVGGMLITMFLSGPPVPEADEGTIAHIFQLWLVLEACMILFFAIRWLPEKPKPALIILALQLLLVVAGCAPVYILHL